MDLPMEWSVGGWKWGLRLTIPWNGQWAEGNDYQPWSGGDRAEDMFS
jgi:hypothetical protein